LARHKSGLSRHPFRESNSASAGSDGASLFIGFLIDRLDRKWNWPAAILAGHIIFALWQDASWKRGAGIVKQPRIRYHGFRLSRSKPEPSDGN